MRFHLEAVLWIVGLGVLAYFCSPSVNSGTTSTTTAPPAWAVIEQLFDHVPDTVFFVKDRAGRYLATNQTLVERCGLRTKAELLGQAVTNLLQNAADSLAMRPVGGDGAAPVGHIAVGVALHGDEVVVVVADDGIGLPGQDRHRLTEPYVTHKPKGTGLGLAIVKKIMEDHGGRVTLDDRVPEPDWLGTGAVACLFLPHKSPG